MRTLGTRANWLLSNDQRLLIPRAYHLILLELTASSKSNRCRNVSVLQRVCQGSARNGSRRQLKRLAGTLTNLCPRTKSIRSHEGLVILRHMQTTTDFWSIRTHSAEMCICLETCHLWMLTSNLATVVRQRNDNYIILWVLKRFLVNQGTYCLYS